MLASATRRFATLVAGTALGGWLAAHLQFGIGGYWGLASDELSVVGFVLLLSLIAVAVLFLPLSLAVGRLVSPAVVGPCVAAVSVAAALLLGVWFYVGFLGRSFGLVLGRDLPFVLCFVVVGLGYAAAHQVQRRI